MHLDPKCQTLLFICGDLVVISASKSLKEILNILKNPKQKPEMSPNMPGTHFSLKWTAHNGRYLATATDLKQKKIKNA